MTEKRLLKTGNAAGQMHIAFAIVCPQNEKWKCIGENEKESGGDHQRRSTMHKVGMP
jgi:hypothetical protein